MKEKLKEWIEKIKAFWANRSKKQKIGIISGAAGILLIALAATVMLNAKPEDNRVLFPGMSTSETQQVYALLREREVDAEINRKGELVVPAAQWETLTFELAGAGYQPTSPNYNFFLDNSGFTKTELEQQATLKIQMEDRMRQLLLAQTGVEYADVSFNIAEESNYIWDQQKQQEGSAAITIRMREDFELTPERVQAVKNLTAYAVPSMKADNVVVIDGRTGLEVLGTEDPDTNQYSTKQLELEQAVAKSIEDNIRRLLTPTYGPDGVTAVVKVVLNFETLRTEQKQYVPEDNGKGVINHYEDRYSQGGTVPAEGLVGEENNTDIPKYGNNTAGNGDNAITNFESSVDYSISEVLTQMERGAPVLERATAAVVVKDPNFTTEREELLVDLVSKGTNISAENIRVTNLDYTIDTVPADTNPVPGAADYTLLIIIGSGVAVLLILLIVFLVLLIRRRKKRKKDAEAQALIDEAEEQRQQMEKEIAEHKLALQAEALANVNVKEDAIVEEVRAFAEQNPEITANLVRSLLKEEK